LRKAVRK